jgi:predicted Fe-Mo cluster-binding NifX family protein
MKIAVATQTKKEDAAISTQAGKSPFYIMFDENGDVLETMKNPFSVGGGGAGFGVAKMLGDKGVTHVAGGKFGSNMTGALKERSIQVYEMEGTAKDAVSRIRQENL